MRVTDKMIFDNAALRSGKARDEVEAASREASTGVRVLHPWDDPGAAAQVIGQRAHGDRMQAIGDVADKAVNELNSADGALQQMNDVMNRARELAVQFSNDTYSAPERAAAAAEVDGLLDQTLALANTKFGSRYVFGGFKDNAPPYASDGSYQGDHGVRQVEAAPGQFEDASVPGDALFGGATNPGATDIFATLKSLATAMRNNDSGAIGATVSGVESSIDQIVQGRAKAGSAVNVLETAKSASQVALEADKAAASKLTDADVITSASRLAYAQRALDAALTASAKTFQLSLVDKM